MTVYNQELGKGCYHWVYLLFSRSNRELYVIDPMKSQGKAGQRKLGENMLKWIAEGHKDKEPGDQKNWNFKVKWNIKHIEHSHQTDNTSCGLLSIKYATTMIDNYPNITNNIRFRTGEEAVMKLRSQYVATFLKHAKLLKK